MMFSPFHRLFKKPEIKPYNQGFVPVLDDHQLHFMEIGNPKGDVILVFHGGPGGEAKIKHALRFDLKKYRVILFSQRGCGKSTYSNLLKNNTPLHTADDAIKILDYLGITQPVILAGGSYGSTVALLTAQKYPERVRALCLNAIFLGRKRDIDWVYQDSVRFYPDLMEDLKIIADWRDLYTYYNDKIHSDLYKEIRLAFKYYEAYEYQLGLLNPSLDKEPVITDTGIKNLKIKLHYEKNYMFLPDNAILYDMYKINTIPMLIVHNRLDMICPIEQAFLLDQHSHNATLIINPDIGHGSASMHQCIKKEFSKFLNGLDNG